MGGFICLARNQRTHPTSAPGSIEIVWFDGTQGMLVELPESESEFIAQ